VFSLIPKQNATISVGSVLKWRSGDIEKSREKSKENPEILRKVEKSRENREKSRKVPKSRKNWRNIEKSREM
jgi:hypothetical protein